MKKLIGIGLIFSCLGCSLYILWEENLRYFIPASTVVHINENLSDLHFLNQEAVNYLHFYDPACLNSRINLDHIPPITDSYQSQANFYLITPNLDGLVDKRIPSYFQIIEDPQGEIARYCGISTTPSAIIAKQGVGSLYANYNDKNGLCGPTTIKYSGPALALDFITRKDNFPLLPSLQTAAIGCELTTTNL